MTEKSKKSQDEAAHLDERSRKEALDGLIGDVVHLAWIISNLDFEFSTSVERKQLPGIYRMDLNAEAVEAKTWAINELEARAQRLSAVYHRETSP